MIQWQDFEVGDGAAGQVEGRLIITDDAGNEYVFTFGFDRDGATWGWRPNEPAFVVTREEE